MEGEKCTSDCAFEIQKGSIRHPLNVSFFLFFPCNQETEDANKVDEKQVSEATDSEEKRDKTKEELEKESTEAKEDEKKSSTDLKELEPVSSKTKGPTVSIDIFLAA